MEVVMAVSPERTAELVALLEKALGLTPRPRAKPRAVVDDGEVCGAVVEGISIDVRIVTPGVLAEPLACGIGSHWRCPRTFARAVPGHMEEVVNRERIRHDCRPR